MRAALHNAELADRWQALGALLRYQHHAARRANPNWPILVTGRACQSPFEWYAHRLEAEKAGIEAPVIDALLAEQMPQGLTDDDASIVRYAVELNRHNSVSDATYADALAGSANAGVVELTALVGYYTMVAMTLQLRTRSRCPKACRRRSRCHRRTCDERRLGLPRPSVRALRALSAVCGSELHAPRGAAADYLALLARLGLAHGVLVHPSAYGDEFSLLFDALAEHPNLRGVVVLRAEQRR